MLKPASHLIHIVQKDGKLLKDYIKSFNLEAMQVHKHYEELALTTIMGGGLRDPKFLFSLDKNPPMTMASLLNRSQKYSNVEEASTLRKSVQSKGTTTKEWQPKVELGSASGSKKRKDDQLQSNPYPNKWPDSKFNSYTSLNKTPEQVLMELQDKRILKWPSKMKASPDRKICTIFGGAIGGGDSNQARRAHARIITHSGSEREILTASRPSKELKIETYSMTFTKEDARGVHHLHNNALVVIMTITNRKVFRILVDTESLADILFAHAFDRMGIGRSQLQAVKTPLLRFSGRRVIPEESTHLPLTARDM
ncbi:uncharacterized protein LOC131220007 [Magnolia sinica]|uniref:uncharacterized protein LOC131220007 n=1 Tax=Magnolia sinica TaxID=86752 RepID=UPI00265B1C13|nr:uncharacterized protein LOC131220007 [Magnolia sinica]